MKVIFADIYVPPTQKLSNHYDIKSFNWAKVLNVFWNILDLIKVTVNVFWSFRLLETRIFKQIFKSSIDKTFTNTSLGASVTK